MRDIKFRAWVEDRDNAVDPWMVYNVGVYPASDKGQAIIEECADGGQYHYLPNALMQYTGLKDKNGTEIYEGDVLRFRSAPSAFPVIFRDGSFAIDFGGGLISPIRALSLDNEEVIGNIHENPDFIDTPTE